MYVHIENDLLLQPTYSTNFKIEDKRKHLDQGIFHNEKFRLLAVDTFGKIIFDVSKETQRPGFNPLLLNEEGTLTCLGINTHHNFPENKIYYSGGLWVYGDSEEKAKERVDIFLESMRQMLHD